MSPRSLAGIVAAVALAAPAQAAATEVHPTRTAYSPTERIDVSWSGLPGGDEVQFWMEPAGTPLSGYPHGSYHTDYQPAGHIALENPGPGRWEVHWSILAQSSVVHQGGAFTVGSPSARRVSRGHYGCYTTTTLGLTRSSIQFVEITSGSRYRALGRTGTYRYDRRTATLRMTSGPLRRRVAHFRPGESPQKVVFLRRENEVRGKPTLDISDTTCYRGKQ